MTSKSSGTSTVDADTALKAKHRAMWALGDYPAVAAEIIPTLGPILVSACGVSSGDRVLDVAAGSGNAAIPAALTGATVIASDLTPELFNAGRAIAAAHKATLEWEQGDAEHLPYDDASFDVVMSCVGVMFAPHHEESSSELVRVTKKGGTIGLISWTPEGFIGQLFATMKPYAAPPPPGAQPPPLWGSESHVRSLFGDSITDVTAEKRTVRVDALGGESDFRDYFKTKYGPTIAAYKNNADDPVKVAALDKALDDLAAQHRAADGSMEWEYLLFTARRAG